MSSENVPLNLPYPPTDMAMKPQVKPQKPKPIYPGKAAEYNFIVGVIPRPPVLLWV